MNSDETFLVRPTENWKLLGTPLSWDKTKTYPAVHATNQPEWKTRGAIFVAHDPEDKNVEFGSILLERGEYVRVDHARSQWDETAHIRASLA